MPPTRISFEFPQADWKPCHLISRAENQALYCRHAALAYTLPDVSFMGCLATDRYDDMDQVVGQAFATYRRLVPQLGHALAAS
jgi:UDP-galactopyranose mutase